MLKRQLSEEIIQLDKEIFEKQSKKMDSKYIVKYVEIFLHLHYLFLSSNVKSDELESLYLNFQTSKTVETDIFHEKSRKTSPKKKKPIKTNEDNDISVISSKEEQVKEINIFSYFLYF